jgi:hypothetical protein
MADKKTIDVITAWNKTSVHERWTLEERDRFEDGPTHVGHTVYVTEPGEPALSREEVENILFEELEEGAQNAYSTYFDVDYNTDNLLEAHNIDIRNAVGSSRDIGYDCPHCSRSINETGDIPDHSNYLMICEKCGNIFRVIY